MSLVTQQHSTTLSTQQNKEKPIKRTKKHEAILKIKQVTQHIEMMKKRNQRLQVIDSENRSKTIQHERKLQQYQNKRNQIKKDKEQFQKVHRLKQHQAQIIKQKNQTFKQQKLKKIAEALQKLNTQKCEGYRNMKQQQQKNENLIMKLKQYDLKQKQTNRRSVSEMQETSKINISRYKERKEKQTNISKSIQYDQLMEKAMKRQKQLQKLSKMEQQMVKKSSQSMQISQVMKNRLREVLGNQRRFTLLPQIHNKNKSLTTRGSTGNTNILSI